MCAANSSFARYARAYVEAMRLHNTSRGDFNSAVLLARKMFEDALKGATYHDIRVGSEIVQDYVAEFNSKHTSEVSQ